MSNATELDQRPRPAGAAPRSAGPVLTSGARLTLIGLLAAGLAILPLKQVFSDWSWVFAAWGGMAVVLLPAAALRLKYPPNVVHLLPGLALGVVYLTVSFLPNHALGGILPWSGTGADVHTLISAFGDSVRDGVAPIHSTNAIRLIVTTQVMLFAIAVDLLATVARRPALVGVPMLFLLVIADAIPRHTVNLLWFVAVAVAFLMLLASGARDELSHWGRALPQRGGDNIGRRIGLSGRQIGVIAIVVALAVPLLLPVRSVNLIANALHNSGSGGGSVTIDAFAGLQGTLNQTKPADLFSVHVSADDSSKLTAEPFYLRQQVLDTYNTKGWVSSGNGDTTPLAGSGLSSQLGANGQLSTSDYTATITVDHLSGNAPLFDKPASITGLNGRFAWSPQKVLAVNSSVSHGSNYTESVLEPRPTPDQIEADTDGATRAELRPWLSLPEVPAPVHTLVERLTANVSGEYAKTTAIMNYFLNPANGFVYSLQTKPGDSDSDLVNFLNEKAGFCQQYAASMAVMLRLAGIPSRVVLGYTHPAPDQNGNFEVTTNDAHAWVEAYFGSVGWIPFDPTPLGGVDAARASNLPWAPHPTQTSVGQPVPVLGGTAAVPGVQKPALPDGGVDGAAPTTTAHSIWTQWPAWVVTAGLLALFASLLSPAITRLSRRRRRLHGTSRPDPLWAELADTAEDLGYVWSPARSPRQVLTWLSAEGLPPQATSALQTITRAVETSRYAEATDPAELASVADLREVERALRARRDRGRRLRARLLPQSVHWVGRLTPWRR